MTYMRSAAENGIADAQPSPQFTRNLSASHDVELEARYALGMILLQTQDLEWAAAASVLPGCVLLDRLCMAGGLTKMDQCLYGTNGPRCLRTEPKAHWLNKAAQQNDSRAQYQIARPWKSVA